MHSGTYSHLIWSDNHRIGMFLFKCWTVASLVAALQERKDSSVKKNNGAYAEKSTDCVLMCVTKELKNKSIPKPKNVGRVCFCCYSISVLRKESIFCISSINIYHHNKNWDSSLHCMLFPALQGSFSDEPHRRASVRVVLMRSSKDLYCYVDTANTLWDNRAAHV